MSAIHRHVKYLLKFINRKTIYRYKSKIAVITASIIGILTIEYLLTIYTFPNTYVDGISLPFKTRQAIRQILSDKLDRPLEIKIKDRVYAFKYQDLGINIDSEETVRQLFASNIEFFPKNFFLFFKSLFVKTRIDPPLVFSSDYYHRLEELVFDFTEKPDETIIDSHDKTIHVVLGGGRYRIDPSHLRFLLTEQFSYQLPYEPALKDVPNQMLKTIKEENQKIILTYEKPIKITFLGLKKEIGITLTSNDIKSLLSVSFPSDTGLPDIGIDKDLLKQILNKNLKKVIPNDKPYSLFLVSNELLSAIKSRYEGRPTEHINITLDAGPNTAGDKAVKYIEVDISQQMMFLFQNGSLYTTYKISSGLYYPTPTGEFKIINKAPNAFSNIYSVWMPYWMAFGYSRENNAYFGIHELPYWISENGKKIQRPRERIGEPSTGGCIALDIGDAKKVYDWADIDMPIVIYK